MDQSSISIDHCSWPPFLFFNASCSLQHWFSYEKASWKVFGYALLEWQPFTTRHQIYHHESKISSNRRKSSLYIKRKSPQWSPDNIQGYRIHLSGYRWKSASWYDRIKTWKVPLYHYIPFDLEIGKADLEGISPLDYNSDSKAINSIKGLFSKLKQLKLELFDL